MAGRRKYIILLLVTACIAFSIIFYKMVRFNLGQKKPDERIENPPIRQNTEQEEAHPPAEEPLQQPATPLQPAPVPVPAPQPPPTPVPIPPPKPKPKPKPKPASKPAEKVVVPKGSIGSCKTPLLDNDFGRRKNIDLASQKINSYIVEPGGIFSFNGVVGERTIQKGYKPAKVIINGEFADDTGGGICQLSSTLYNAAEKAGLQIIERHHHSRKVSYVMEGHDAAVDYGNLDLKFKNSLNYPIEIKAGVQNKEVYAFIIKAH